jgi:lipopolysaccharide transport protein LptA
VLVDTAQQTELRAQAIDIVTGSGDLAARTGVRHVLRRKNAKGGLLGAGEEPVLVTSRFFEYVAKTRTAHYKEDALLRSGKDEVRAAEIRLTEAADGRRRLEGEGSVISRMQPTSGEKKAAAVEGRAQKMVYEEAQGRIVYTGEVVIRQGDIVTRSPGATLTLTADGKGIETLKAGEPVEVEQGARRASGRQGTYSPAAETMLLVGEKVVLKDPMQTVEGRSLTFHVGDERILVDGREEVRTQMIIKQESR